MRDRGPSLEHRRLRDGNRKAPWAGQRGGGGAWWRWSQAPARRHLPAEWGCGCGDVEPGAPLLLAVRRPSPPCLVPAPCLAAAPAVAAAADDADDDDAAALCTQSYHAYRAGESKRRRHPTDDTEPAATHHHTQPPLPPRSLLSSFSSSLFLFPRFMLSRVPSSLECGGVSRLCTNEQIARFPNSSSSATHAAVTACSRLPGRGSYQPPCTAGPPPRCWPPSPSTHAPP